MIIVLDLAGNPLCYLFNRKQREQFAASVPETSRAFLTFKVLPAFKGDKDADPYAPIGYKAAMRG